MSTVIFTTSRLVVRQWNGSEVEDLLGIYGDPEVVRWIGDRTPITRQECEQWVEVTLANYRKRGYGMFAVEERGTPGVAGFAGIVHPGGQVEAEVKYALRPPAWGRGLATELVMGIVRHATEHHALRRLIATTFPENLASHRVLVKAGFRRGEDRVHEDGGRTWVFVWDQ